MTHTSDIERPSKELIEGLASIGSATATGELSRLGIRDPYLRGPVAWTPGKTVVGPALTLQFMPKREDLYGVDEYADPEKQLHRHVLYHTQPGDIVVVRLFYKWPLYVTGLGFNIANVGTNQKLLTATAAFQNEPY